MLLSIKHFDVGVAAGLLGQRSRLAEIATATRVLMRFVRGEPLSELAQFRVPCLLLVGEYEAIYNPQVALRRATQAIPNISAEIVPETGHAAIYDRPEMVNPRIIQFLNS